MSKPRGNFIFQTKKLCAYNKEAQESLKDDKVNILSNIAQVELRRLSKTPGDSWWKTADLFSSSF